MEAGLIQLNPVCI